MEAKRLGDLLPDVGIKIVAEFAKEINRGVWKDKDYLDIHAALREQLRPHLDQAYRQGITDIDYLVLVILNGLGVKNNL